MLSLACLTTIGVSLWGQQLPERTTVSPPHRSAREKPDRSLESKSGPAPIVEPTDLLVVEVLEALPGRPISGERLVRPDGTISLGFYGDVHVAGLTLAEIKEKIVLHLRKYLIAEILGLVTIGEDDKPQEVAPRDSSRVFVDVTAYNSQVYYVEGDVYYPSRLPYTGNDTVLDVVHYVGGIIPSADRSKIVLIRSFPKGSPVKVLPIDYEEITMGTDSTTNYQLLPGDRLVVPRRPDNPSQASASPRPPQSRSSRPSFGSYFDRSISSGEGEDGPLKSLQAVERHLNEVENKLERLIDVMQSATKVSGSKGQNDTNELGSRSRPTGGPLAEERIPDDAGPPLPAGGRDPFQTHSKPPGPPKNE